MITPDGYIFDKEAILSYIVEQKKDQKRLMKAYEKYMELEEQKNAMVYFYS
jgi:nitric oxide synthase-interacting protein